jgi:hypothetical protein
VAGALVGLVDEHLASLGWASCLKPLLDGRGHGVKVDTDVLKSNEEATLAVRVFRFDVFNVGFSVGWRDCDTGFLSGVCWVLAVLYGLQDDRVCPF